MAKPSRVGLILAIVAPLTACSMVPKGQLSDCHKLSRTLQAENAQLQDSLLSLKSKNRDLTEQAVRDARRLASLEEVNQRLERSVAAYQDEREKLAASFEKIKAELRAAGSPSTRSARGDDGGVKR